MPFPFQATAPAVTEFCLRLLQLLQPVYGSGACFLGAFIAAIIHRKLDLDDRFVAASGQRFLGWRFVAASALAASGQLHSPRPVQLHSP